MSKRIQDFKGGNVDPQKHFFKGQIRQRDFSENNAIYYPNKPFDIHKDHYAPIIKRINSTSMLEELRAVMNPQEYFCLLDNAKKARILLDSGADNNILEKTLVEIQRLPSFPKVFNVIGSYTIPNIQLTNKELLFVEEMAQYVKPEILSNPRNMQHFLLKSLKVYKKYIEPKTFEILAPLKKPKAGFHLRLII